MKKLNSLLLFLLFTVLSSTINAQAWVQIGADIDGEAAYDNAGYSVSLSSDGSTVAISALMNDGNGSDAGHVKIYQNISGTWTQVGQNINGEAADDQFGSSVSLSSDGSTVAIGAYMNDGNGTNAGHVRIYKYISSLTSWLQIGEDLDGEAADDWFGISVSLSSDGLIVAIGAPNNGEFLFETGNVKIYQFNTSTWTQIGADIDGEADGDDFGISVSLSSDGETVAIGARNNDGNGGGSGHVRIYQNESDTWTQIGADIDGEAYGDQSGSSVSLSNDGSIVAIGALGNETYSGHVRIYQNESGTWTQIGSDIDGEEEWDVFGYSVSLSNDGSIVAIGAIGIETYSGHVRIYQNISGTWTQIGADIVGEAADDWFGNSVSLSSNGSIVAIGAPNNDGNGTDAGHVRVFKNPYSGISDVLKTDISIFPNPTNSIVNVNFAKIKNLRKVEIIDIAGKTIITKTDFQQTETFDLSNFDSGIYIISIHTEDKIFTYKIVKE